MQIGKDMVYTHQRAVVLCTVLESSTVRLGIKRDVSGTVNIEEKVILSRKTAYSLMGAGFTV